MVEIRIYVEGGGDGKNSKATLRQGMSQFLRRLTKQPIKCIVCGKRNDAYRDFINALKSHPDAINLLLVDSEDFVRVKSPKQHLINRDKWNLSGIDENQIHLMVQVMESWIIADVDTLAKFYGQKFNKKAIPLNKNVEQVAKVTIESALKKATRLTSRGEYHKIKHSSKLLEKIDVCIVRQKAPYCERLYKMITSIIEDNRL